MTGREREVLQLIGQGLTAEAAGRRLRISARTVSKHLQHAYDKLERHDRLLAVTRARQLGLLW